jgi:hypothetical protein
MEQFKIISHRGNVEGIDLERENHLDAIIECIEKYKFDVEIDVHVNNGIIEIGHDLPCIFDLTESEFEKTFTKHSDSLWIHCKNIESISFFAKYKNKYNYFGHSNDDFVLTSRGDIFTKPGVVHDSAIVVMPELISENIDSKYFFSRGILTDYPISYEAYYNTLRA